MPKKRKGKLFWVTRDDDEDSGYEIWPYKEYPQQGTWGGYSTGSSIELCCNDFEAITGETLKPGERVAMKLVRA